MYICKDIKVLRQYMSASRPLYFCNDIVIGKVHHSGELITLADCRTGHSSKREPHRR